MFVLLEIILAAALEIACSCHSLHVGHLCAILFFVSSSLYLLLLPSPLLQACLPAASLPDRLFGDTPRLGQLQQQQRQQQTQRGTQHHQ